MSVYKCGIFVCFVIFLADFDTAFGKVICDDNCQENGGECIGPGKCFCPKNRFGLNCVQNGCKLPKGTSTNSDQETIFSPGQTVKDLFCDLRKGLILSSDHEMTCREDGTWSNIVNCIKGCRRPINSAEYDSNRYLFRPLESLSIMPCNDGYILTSPNRMICQKDGSWSEIVTCQKVVCDDQCQENGGICVGPGKCSCPKDRFGLNCVQKGCTIPKDTPTYRGQETIFRPGQTAKDFVCDQDNGFILSSDQGMTCRVNGTWSDVVKCIKGCKPPNNVANYTGIKQIFGEGETLHNLFCYHGYILSSHNVMECQNDGSWSEIVTCEKGCILPKDVAKHECHKDIYRQGETLNDLFCNDGYFLSSQNGMECRQDGSWSEIVTCEKECTLPNYVANHRDHRKHFRPGERLNGLFCKDGYILSSQNEMVCRQDGSWSENVKCEKVCNLPNDVAKHRDHTEKNIFRHGEKLTGLYCDRGYILSSRNEMVCRYDGSWSEIVKCKKAIIYHISVKTSNLWRQVPRTNVFITLHGSDRKTERVNIAGYFNKGDLDETRVEAKNISPIISVDVQNSGKSDLHLVYVSIYIETFEEYYVFKKDEPVLVNGRNENVVTLPRSGNPGNCVIKFDEGLRWFPKSWHKISLYNVGSQRSARHCKQACITQNRIPCRSVYYNNWKRSCICISVSDKEYFSEKREPWNSRIYIPFCK